MPARHLQTATAAERTTAVSAAVLSGPTRSKRKESRIPSRSPKKSYDSSMELL